MVEGNDDNNAYFAENRGRYRAPSTLSANAVQEFQVGQGAYQAEFGRASGGSVNMVLRSGANNCTPTASITIATRVWRARSAGVASSLRSGGSSWADRSPGPSAPTRFSTL